MKSYLLRPAGFVAAILLLAGFQLRAQTNSADITPQAVLTAMQRVADWQLAHPVTERPTGWICSVGDVGMMALAGISGDAKYRDAMLAKGETNRWLLPEYQGRKYHADDQCYGQVCAELYFLYRENRMIAPMRGHFDWILDNPAPSHGLENNLGQDQWSWCDALFMAPPAWMRLYAATGDERYMDFAVTNWWRTADYLYDKDEHLFFRDSSFFTKTEANGKKTFWSRGNGWVFAATVRMLQSLPMNHPDRPRFEQLFKDMAAKILSLQQPDGMWRASLLDPESYPMPEASGSGMFVYGLAWGVNQGLLDRATYEPAVRKAWPALVGCVDADGKLTHVQPAGSAPVKFAEDSTAPYGGGVFLLAGSEVYRMVALRNMSYWTEFPIQMQDVPISIVISSLALTAGINCVIDPELGYGQTKIIGISQSEPSVNFGPTTNLTPGQALLTILTNCNLQLVRESVEGQLRITKWRAGVPTANIDLSTKYLLPLADIIRIKNPSSFQRNCETVELTVDDLASVFNENLTDVSLAILDGVSSRILDSQIYESPPHQASTIPVAQIEPISGKLQVSSYTPQPQKKLLFQVDLAPGEIRTFYILNAAALAAVPPPIVKTFARYVPERMDDFAWESDRIAHRIYGQGLIKGEGTITSGIDVWIKKDRSLIVDTMYATKRYHEDNGSFMDDYRVGKSAGDGGSGIWDGQKFRAAINYRNWKLITIGPIRSEFEATYDAWDAGNGRMVSLTKRISIDAGSWLSRAQDTFASDDKSPLTVAVGLAERACPTNREEYIAHDQAEGWTTYWQPEDQPKGIIGVAVILPKGGVTAFTNDAPDLPDSVVHGSVPQPTVEGYPPIRNMLAVSQAQVGQPFTYYFGACWDRGGDFTNQIQWENYVKRFAERRDQPLQVTIGN